MQEIGCKELKNNTIFNEHPIDKSNIDKFVYDNIFAKILQGWNLKLKVKGTLSKKGTKGTFHLLFSQRYWTIIDNQIFKGTMTQLTIFTWIDSWDLINMGSSKISDLKAPKGSKLARFLNILCVSDFQMYLCNTFPIFQFYFVEI